MRYWIRVAAAVLLMVCFCLPSGAETTRKQTLMIYMCGSNLESSYGSASADISEMLEAGLTGRDVTILVMTGGTTSWSQGYDATQTQISELGPRGMRVVWRDDAMNMGDPATLTQLLTFGQEKYPAQAYSLILWDHGGGPLEGVCWDELHGMDHLSLEEMTGAIAAAGLEQKLSWIGFDACLMSTLEVAHAVAPYAQYMIASQETEPVTGWNYGFISGLAQDADGSETGRRIVDLYFEGTENSTDILTLACMDLSQVQTVSDAMDGYFTSLSRDIDEALFTVISDMRRNVTGFGRVVRANGDNGYDLVDLCDLVRRLGNVNEETAQLNAALDSLIVYSRANITDAGGVSVYHPYVNKDKYLGQWRQDYGDLAISQGYQQYVQRFGALLTGEALALWEHLYPVASAPDAMGVQEITMQLTPEQAAQTASTELVLLRSYTYTSEPGSYAITGVVPATLDESGMLHARAEWNALYLVDSQGNKHGPLDYEIMEDGRYIARSVRFNTERTLILDESVHVLYVLEEDPETRQPKIVMTFVFDEATQSWTNRHAFDAAKYKWMQISTLPNPAPEDMGNGVYPSIWAWPTDSNLYLYTFADVSGGWHFSFEREMLSNEDVLALFQITDTQQTVRTSAWVPLEIPGRTAFTVTSGPAEAEGVRMDMTGYISRVEKDRGLWIEMTLTNTTQTAVECSIQDPIINGEKAVPWADSVLISTRKNLEPGETKTLTMAVSAQDMYDLTQIDAIDMDVQVDTPEDSSWDRTPVHFELSGCDVSDISKRAEVKGRVEIDGITWELLDIQMDDITGVNMWFRITNNRAEKLDFYQTNILLNHVSVDTISLQEVQPGKTAVVSVHVYDDVSEFAGVNSIELVSRVQESYGHDEIRDITIVQDVNQWTGKLGAVGTITLETPWKISRINKGSMSLVGYNILLDEDNRVPVDELLPLVENRLYSVRLDKIVTMHEQDDDARTAKLLLCLHMTNHSDENLYLNLDEVLVNGEAGWLPMLHEGYALIPDETRVCMVELEREDPIDIDREPPLERMSMQFSALGLQNEPIVVELDLLEPAGWEKEFGTFILPEDLTTSCTGDDNAALRSLDNEWQGPVSPFMAEVLVPENAAQYRVQLKAPITVEQAARAVKGSMVFGRLDEASEHLSIVGIGKLSWRRNGDIVVDTSGLMLTNDDGDMLIPMTESVLDGKKLILDIYDYMTIHEETNNHWFGEKYISDLQVRLDYETNQASWKLCDSALQVPEKQRMYTKVESGAFLIPASEFDAEPILHMIDLPSQRHKVEADISASPLQLELRPYADMEDIYVLFSFVEEDGTAYSLPLVAYQELLEAE